MQSSAPVQKGQIIAGKYQVERVLGEGGMGIVVAAWHTGLQQRVAIKFLLSEIVEGQDGASERFRREGRAAARIRSEHVCRVIDVGTLENGVPFMVMEYLEGGDLSQELASHGKIAIDIAIEHILQACEALAEAHVAGIIHRDLKPANLFLATRPDGTRAIKVLDFGVSKSLGDSSGTHLSLTRTSSLVGSPIYMAPEQIESSKDVDSRADIWSLGTILYELVTGRTPFTGTSIAQLVHAVLNNEPPSFADLEVTAPAGFEQVVLRALAKNRDERYASVGELAAALEPFASLRAAASVTRVARVLAPGSSVPRAPLGATSLEIRAPLRSSVRRRRTAGAALLLIPLILIALYFAFRSESPEAPASAAAPNVVAPAKATALAAPAPAAVQPAPEPAPAAAPEPAAPPPSAASVAIEPAHEAAAAPAAPPPTRPSPAEPAVVPGAQEHSRKARAETPAAAIPAPTTKPDPPPSPGSSISDFGGRR